MIDREEFRARVQAIPDADGDRERFCDECGARVTEVTDGTHEVGHMSHCSQRSDDLRDYTHDARKDGGPA